MGFNQDTTHEISEKDILHSTDFVDIGGKLLIKNSVREQSSVSMVAHINGLMILIYSVIKRKSTLDFHKRIRSEYGRNPSGIATPTTNIIYPHSNFSFPNLSEEDFHHYVEPLQPNVPEKNIDYNDRINQRFIDDDVDFEWI